MHAVEGVRVWGRGGGLWFCPNMQVPGPHLRPGESHAECCKWLSVAERTPPGACAHVYFVFSQLHNREFSYWLLTLQWSHTAVWQIAFFLLRALVTVWLSFSAGNLAVFPLLFFSLCFWGSSIFLYCGSFLSGILCAFWIWEVIIIIIIIIPVLENPLLLFLLVVTLLCFFPFFGFRY